MWKLSLLIALTLVPSAFAAQSKAVLEDSEPLHRELGQEAVVEFDAQAGTYSSLRAQGIFYSGDRYNLAAEAMFGASYYGSSALYPKTYGAGLRGEFYLWSNGRRKAWMISPGMDTYYIPPTRARSTDTGDTVQSFANSLDNAINYVPTRVVFLAPNVDVYYLYQPNPRFGFVVGGRFGWAAAVAGTNDEGEDLRGKVYPELSAYVGTRF